MRGSGVPGMSLRLSLRYLQLGSPVPLLTSSSFIYLAKATTFNWINLLGRFSVRKLLFFGNAVPHHSGPLQKPLFSVIVIYCGFNPLNEKSKWIGWHPVNVLQSTVQIHELNKCGTTFVRIFTNQKLLSSTLVRSFKCSLVNWSCFRSLLPDDDR